ncbi:HVA22-like protein [Drosera capensis]
MALLGANIAGDVGLRLLLSPFGSNVVLRTACCTVGTVLPVYSTFKSIERKDHNEQQKWLIYWTAYGSFSLVEVFSDKILSWFPLYYHFKFAFLVWLQLPTSEGANQLYVNHIRPFFLRHQQRFDQILGCAHHEIAKLVRAHQTEIQFLISAIVKVAGSVDHFLRGDDRPGRAQNGRAIQASPRSTDPNSVSDDEA